ncbi:MAG: tetratricopeptide repeat protein [Bacteroidales bacterium]|jgi:tetratricopeptide (TPR) repeat protein|nr:tetratricopeptide repeat protein [Bacteroidales bacterium]
MNKIYFTLILSGFSFVLSGQDSVQTVPAVIDAEPELSVLSPDSLLSRGNRHYADGDYEHAAACYEAVLAQDVGSAEVYYNLGNACYKRAQYTRAIINYERARMLAPCDDDISANLELANQHIVDAIKPIPRLFISRWAANLGNMFTVWQWAVASLVALALAAFLGLLFLFAGRRALRKVSFWTGALCILTVAITCSFAVRQKRLITEHKFAIITRPNITVKSTPSESGTDLFVIHEGLKVELKESLGDWTQIRLSDGNQGWLPDTSFEKL